jgi:hypothetical protein
MEIVALFAIIPGRYIFIRSIIKGQEGTKSFNSIFYDNLDEKVKSFVNRMRRFVIILGYY